MISFFRTNFQFVILLSVWFVVGVYLPLAVAAVLVFLSVVLLGSKFLSAELLIGFFFILTLSDSRLYSLSFAGDVKNIYIVVLAAIIILSIEQNPLNIPLFKYILPFLIISGICLVYSPTVNIAIQKTLSYALLFMIVPALVSRSIAQKGTGFFRDFIWFIALLLIIGVILKVLNPSVVSLAGRFRGILGNPNGLGIFTTLFVVFFFTVNTLYQQVFSRNEKIFIYCLCFLNLYMCGSRASLLATCLFLLLANFYAIDNFMGFIIFILLVFFYQFISSNIDAIVVYFGLQDFFRIDTLNSGSGRLVAWNFAWENIQKTFFIGRGFNFTEHLFKINQGMLNQLGHQGAAHNTYLTIWLDTGLVGLIAFLGGLIGIFYKIKKITPIAFPILYAVMFSNQFESWLTASLNPFTILFLIIISSIYYVGYGPRNNEVKIDENPLPLH